MNKEFYMKRAIRLAKRGQGRTSPNPLVGAVIVKDGRIISEGYHKKAGMPHAEIEALRAAGEGAKGADLYVNLEPCNHFGRTPPCTKAIIEAGISRVFVGMRDPNPHVKGGGIECLNSHGIKVEVGILEEECRRLNEVFIKYITKNIPFVILKLAASLDGKIALANGESKWITNEQSRRFVHRLRDRVDAVLVGIGTVLKDDPRLTARLPGAKDPIRVILDTHLRIPLTARVLNLESAAKTIIITGPEASVEKIKKIEERGGYVIQTDIKNDLIDLNELLLKLGKMEITSILVEGGSKVAASFLKEKLVDKFYFFYAPKIIGGNHSISMIGGNDITSMKEAIPLREVKLRRFGEDILATGYVNLTNIIK